MACTQSKLQLHDQEGQHGKDEDPSGLAAGLVRGLARSWRSVVQPIARPALGRLPVRTARLPAQSVAKVADRLGNAMDVAAEAPSLKQASDVNSKARLLARARSFGYAVAKNSLLGTAVFESYDFVLQTLAHSKVMRGSCNEKMDAPPTQIPFPWHFGAGMCAGAAHAGLQVTIEAVALQTRPAVLTCIGTALHHIPAHGVLFGSYEVFKSALLEGSSHLHEQLVEFDEPAQREIGTWHVVAVATAGGLAGQLQHMVSHFTESLGEPVGSHKSFRHFLQEWFGNLRLTGMPSARSLFVAFPSTALAFVAFEFGKDLANPTPER